MSRLLSAEPLSAWLRLPCEIDAIAMPLSYCNEHECLHLALHRTVVTILAIVAIFNTPMKTLSTFSFYAKLVHFVLQPRALEILLCSMEDEGPINPARKK